MTSGSALLGCWGAGVQVQAARDRAIRSMEMIVHQIGWTGKAVEQHKKQRQ
jgi:hypothetical protein